MADDRLDGRLTIPQAAQALGLSTAIVRHWIRRGHLPSVRHGRFHLVKLSEVRALQAREHLGTVLPAWRADQQRAGQRLRALREAAGLSQEALSRASGLTHEAISRLETGVYAPYFATVRTLAAALAVPPERFVDDRALGLSMLTTTEAARRLDVPLDRLYVWLGQGQLAGTKASGRWRVPAVAVAELERSGRLRGRSRRLDPRYRG